MMESDKIREAIAIRPLVLDLREYANNLPDEIVNNYHEDLDSLILVSSKEMQSAQEEIERMKCCGNCEHNGMQPNGPCPRCTRSGMPDVVKDRWEAKG